MTKRIRQGSSNLTVRVPDSLRAKLKQAAAKDKRSPSDVLRLLLEDALDARLDARLDAERKK